MSLLAVALVLAAATAAAGQQPVVTDPAQPLALVVRYANGREVRRTIGPTYRSWTPMFPKVDGWIDPPGTLAVTAVRYVGIRGEDGLRMTVSVLRGPQHQQQVEIARVLLTGPTPVQVLELAAVGVQPVEMWIEPGDRTRVFPPAAENHTAGLDIASIEMLDGPPAAMVAVIRNVSGKAAVSYSVDLLGADRRLLLSAWQLKDSGQPVLEPGGSHTFRMQVADVPQPELLVLTGVRWTDGTFEGDAKGAAGQWCRDAAGRVQIDRILALLRAAAATSSPVVLSQLAAKAHALEIVATPAMVAEVTSRLAAPSPMTDGDMAAAIAFYLQHLKKEFIGEIAAARPRAGNAAATREWFDAAIAAYADRLAGLSTR